MKKNKKILQILDIKLKPKENAYLIRDNACYFLDELTNLYEPFIIKVSKHGSRMHKLRKTNKQ